MPKAFPARARPPLREFRAIPLISIFMGLFGRRSRRPVVLRQVPQDPDWDRENPMSGLS